MTASHRLTAALSPCKPARPWRLCASAALACALFLMPGPALAVSDDAVLRRMDAVLEENIRLRDDAWKARKNGRDAAKQAEDALNASDDRLERTRAEALAHVAGVTPNQVESLRKDGKSWGQAAGELGVHPGFLGVGKAPLYESLPKRKAAAETVKTKGKRGQKGQEKIQPQAKGKRTPEPKATIKKTAKKSTKSSPAAPAKSEKKTKKSKKKD